MPRRQKKKLRMSFHHPTIPFIFIILALFYRNGFRHPIFRRTEHVISCHFSVLKCQFQGISVKPVVNTLHGFYFANGDGRSDDQKDDSPDPMPQKETPEPEEPKPEQPRAEEPKEEVQRQEEETPRPRSRIETYDEFARFRDLNRPPDTHYPPRPGPGNRRSSASYVRYSTVVCVGVSAALIRLY